MISYPAIASAIIKKENWIPKPESARTIEKESVLGPLFSISSLPTTAVIVADTLFPSTLPQEEIQENVNHVRNKLLEVHMILQDIVLTLLKSSPESKEAVLQWFSVVLNTNMERIRLRGDINNSSSDGFFLNLTAVLLLLCQPFIEKPASISTTFMATSSRLDLSNETKMNCSAEEFQKYVQTLPKKPTNFIADCFLFTLRSLQIGYLVVIERYKYLFQRLYETEQAKASLENTRHVWANTPRAQNNETVLADISRKLVHLKADKVATEAHVKLPEVLERICSFYSLSMRWMLGIASPNNTFPLAPQAPMAFKALPEFMVMDIIDYHLFLERHAVDVFSTSNNQVLLTFQTAFIDQDDYVHNPYIRSKLINVWSNKLYSHLFLDKLKNYLFFCSVHGGIAANSKWKTRAAQSL